MIVADKYELVREIGRGGMGAVWEAQHVSLGRRVAIKFIEADLADNADARRRFENEARAAAALDSRYAAQVFDHGVTDDGRPFIVMELLAGESLASRVSRSALSLSEIARVVRDVARGLGRAHERGIIHRDLKLENVFLSRGSDGDEEVAKVLDFGVAKVLRPLGVADVATSMTRSGTLLGTPYYMSPEQARGLSIDQRSDIWSLAVVVYRCVTGRFPFEGASIGDLLVKICVDPIPVPSQVDAALPQAFDAWMQRALARDPAHRFASVREMSDALDAIAGTAPAISVETIGSARTLPSFPPVHTPTPLGTALATLAPKQRSSSRAVVALTLVACFAGFVLGSVRVVHHASAAARVPVETTILPPAPVLADPAPVADAGASTTIAPVPAISSATKRPVRADIQLTR